MYCLCCSIYFCVLCIICFVTFPVLLVCICVLNNCHPVATQLQLNISYNIAETRHLMQPTKITYVCSAIHIKYRNHSVNLMFMDPCIIVKFIKKNPTRCNNVSKFYYFIFIWSSTCFGRNTAHHQEPKTALAASGLSYVEGCWTCSWWTLSGTVCLTKSTNHTKHVELHINME